MTCGTRNKKTRKRQGKVETWVEKADTKVGEKVGIRRDHRGGSQTVSWDQATNFRHDDIIIKKLKSGHSINKAANLRVDARLVSSTGKVVDHRLNLTRWHIDAWPKNATEDNCKVYNVAHHKAHILLAKKIVESPLYTTKRTHSPILVTAVEPRSSRTWFTT